ncbi:MAG: hypothetical protein LBI03_08655 [Clostridiales bacterium]|jgi:hypothetical protein|nr:hypothetical protein [Clostridiales bacterium]
MLEKEFYNWLKKVKYPNDNGTAKTRRDNCLRICKFEGDLDGHYEKDLCSSLIKKLSYSTEDERHNRPTKHKIPIDGNKRTGTATYKQAVKLYVEFKNEQTEDCDNGNSNNESNFSISDGTVKIKKNSAGRKIITISLTMEETKG